MRRPERQSLGTRWSPLPDFNIRVLYAVTLALDASKGANGLLRSVHSWISSDRREHIPFDALLRNGKIPLPSGAVLDVCYTDSQSPYLHAVRYSHADRVVAGRVWITEIGIRAIEGGDAIQASVVLSTQDVSTSAAIAATPTRPRIVGRLLAANAPAIVTPGLQVKAVSSDSAATFAAFVRDQERATPIALVSTPPGGTPLVDVERLRELACGIADVFVIDGAVDTHELADRVGRDVVPWGGGIRIIFPASTGPYADHVPVLSFRPEQIDDWRIQGDNPTNRVFSTLASRTARTNASRHINIELVREEQIRRRVAKERDRHQAIADRALYSAAQAERNELSASIAALQRDIADYEQILSERDNEIAHRNIEMERLEIECDDLREQLNAATNKAKGLQDAVEQLRDRPSQPEHAVQDELRAAIINMGNGKGTLLDALRTISAVYPDRLVVLPTAWRAAEDASGFRKVVKAFDLLSRLGGEYWEVLSSGKPDSQAKEVFTKNEFASSESDTLTKRGRQRRTFQYRGRDVEMMAHLKIGVKPSEYETLRVHFHWDAEASVIAIGHCGAHLDFD